MAKNVLGTELEVCCFSPRTGYYRDGFCNTGLGDDGAHVICAEMTDEFLEFTAQQGNDLSSPNEAVDFPGLVAGDRWCLCVARWKEAFDAGCAPPVVMEATHVLALEFVELDQLKLHAAPPRE